MKHSKDQNKRVCLSTLVCVSIDSSALGCDIFRAGFEERLEDRVWILEIIVDDID